jgi:hypothetical protein
LQRAFIKHDEEKDKLIMEERAKGERLVKQNTRLREVMDGLREMHLDEKSHMEDRIEREKNKVEKCKRSMIKFVCRQEEIKVEKAGVVRLYALASELEG